MGLKKRQKDFICGYKPVVEYLNSLISLDRSTALAYIENIYHNTITEEERITLVSILMRYRLLPMNENKSKKCRFFSYLCVPKKQSDLLYNLYAKYLQKNPNGPAFCHIYSRGKETTFPLLSEECRMAIEKRIRAIPPPLAIAQGGLESTWGVSNFSKKGNNFYGIQTVFSSSAKTKKIARCIPARKNPKRCVYRFNSIEMGYFTYAQILNSSNAYISLRKHRYESLLNRDTPCKTSLKMAWGLNKYAQDKSYVTKVRSTIKNICKIIDNC